MTLAEEVMAKNATISPDREQVIMMLLLLHMINDHVDDVMIMMTILL